MQRTAQQLNNRLEELKPQFAADSNAKFFLGKKFFCDYLILMDILRNQKCRCPNKDSIIALPDGGVFGPYVDGKNYVLAKKISTKIITR